MAVFSAIKNKKNQKLREGIEDLAVKCGDVTEKDAGNVDVRRVVSRYLFNTNFLHQVNLVVKQLEKMNIKLEEKEVDKMEKMADKNRKISR